MSACLKLVSWHISFYMNVPIIALLSTEQLLTGMCIVDIWSFKMAASFLDSNWAGLYVSYKQTLEATLAVAQGYPHPSL